MWCFLRRLFWTRHEVNVQGLMVNVVWTETRRLSLEPKWRQALGPGGERSMQARGVYLCAACSCAQALSHVQVCASTEHSVQVCASTEHRVHVQMCARTCCTLHAACMHLHASGVCAHIACMHLHTCNNSACMCAFAHMQGLFIASMRCMQVQDLFTASMHVTLYVHDACFCMAIYTHGRCAVFTYIYIYIYIYTYTYVCVCMHVCMYVCVCVCVCMYVTERGD